MALFLYVGNIIYCLYIFMKNNVEVGDLNAG